MAQGSQRFQDPSRARNSARNVENARVDRVGICARSGRAPDEAIQAAEAWLDWMRGTQSDYEIALPIHHLESMAGGFGYYAGLSADVRRAQIDWFLEVYDQLYPTLRIFLYDAHRVFSAPVTVFGPKIAAIYLGQQYVVFRDRERVQNVTRHFDWHQRAKCLPCCYRCATASASSEPCGLPVKPALSTQPIAPAANGWRSAFLHGSIGHGMRPMRGVNLCQNFSVQDHIGGFQDMVQLPHIGGPEDS